MRKVGGGQLAVGSGRRLARPRRFPLSSRSTLPAVLCLLLLPPAAHCLLPTAIAHCLLPTASAAGAWTKQRSGSLAWLHAVYFLDERKGWAVGGKGALLSTEDGGETWRVNKRPTEDALRDVYFSDDLQGWLVCERSIYDLKEKDEPRTYLLHTADGGATWKLVNVIGKDVDARLVRALFTNDGRGWAFGEEGALYTTRDGGANWERQRVPTRNLLLGGWFLNSEQGWLVGAGATLLQTIDGGETWHAGTLINQAVATVNNEETRRVRFTATSFVDKKRGWAVGAEGRVFATQDGGRTWGPQNSNVEADLYDVKFPDALEGWAAGAGGTLIHTLDGGRHWTVTPTGTTHALERLCFIGRTRGWVVGFGGTIISYTPLASPPRPPVLKKISE
ncbi:MAG TPA: YCF48-related protein [Pyrinomonadaceae bacterium]|nr:YCF48-related protein [Pyrinomonadaceae bacterium]